MDILDFKEGDFRNLRNFLGYFATARYEGATDDQVVTFWVAGSKPHERKQVLDEAKALLAFVPFPRAFLQRIANRYFPTEDFAKEWLTRIRSLVKSVRVEGEEARQEARARYPSSLGQFPNREYLDAQTKYFMDYYQPSSKKPGKPRWKESGKSHNDSSQ
jgi:hypothetical protein